ncbi:ABC transporter substrate-binding protein [Brevibacillus fluminis]|uniref:ABC transporter substrate-binding protein n=2 Tax=Brevibacillus fluminis TaxID=511487 RepID=A0A3M8D0A0_9BACL|nr:ABC transporter substrate-binding protein [Brevibacillus fluminis]
MKGNKRGLRSIFLSLVGTMVIPLVVGCSSGLSGSPSNQPLDVAKPKTGGTITVAYPTEPDTLDAHGRTEAGLLFAYHLGGTLLYKDSATQEIKPSLAKEYKISVDGKKITFTIRSGITMHDGTPVTAKTFKETFDRALNPDTQAMTASSFLDGVISVKAPDDQTLILELKAPAPYMLFNLTNPVLQPLSLKAIEKYGADYGRHPVGVGPWKFESWVPGQGVTLSRNDAFQWGEPYFENQGPPRADKLVLKTIIDVQSRLAALESGSIDVATEIPTRYIQKYRNNPKYQVIERMKDGTGTFLSINLRNPMFQDVQVRKALNMLVNKEAIIQSVLQGEGQVANVPLSPTALGYDKSVEEYGYKYNVEEAKKLFDATGWKLNEEGIREKDGKTLTLTLLSSDIYNKAAQLIQSMLGEAGIKVTIQNLELMSELDAGMKGNFDLMFLESSYEDPDNLYYSFHSSQIGGYNFGAVNDSKLDTMLEKGHTTYDLEARKQAYAEVQKQIIEQAYTIPLYYDKQFTVVNSRVKGVKQIDNLRLEFNDSWVDR